MLGVLFCLEHEVIPFLSDLLHDRDKRDTVYSTRYSFASHHSHPLSRPRKVHLSRKPSIPVVHLLQSPLNDLRRDPFIFKPLPQNMQNSLARRIPRLTELILRGLCEVNTHITNLEKPTRLRMSLRCQTHLYYAAT